MRILPSRYGGDHRHTPRKRIPLSAIYIAEKSIMLDANVMGRILERVLRWKPDLAFFIQRIGALPNNNRYESLPPFAIHFRSWSARGFSWPSPKEWIQQSSMKNNNDP
jgi:hypothetical protein